jgi:DDE superfamily endonuclease
MFINDGFATHESAELIEFCFETNIVLCRLPSHTSLKLQPLDVGIFGPLKTAYRDQVEQLYRGGAETVGKPHFTLLYSRAREVAFTQTNITSAWKKSGLVPFDRQCVLSTIARPRIDPALAPVIVPDSETLTPGAMQQTPVTTESFAALRCLIEGESSHLDRQHQHRMKKALNAGERAMAECGLLSEERQNLRQQNCEKKTRASARSTVVGTARVMSYEDIVEARRRQ